MKASKSEPGWLEHTVLNTKQLHPDTIQQLQYFLCKYITYEK